MNKEQRARAIERLERQACRIIDLIERDIFSDAPECQRSIADLRLFAAFLKMEIEALERVRRSRRAERAR